jgi:hypothetical protein
MIADMRIGTDLRRRKSKPWLPWLRLLWLFRLDVESVAAVAKEE